jgi:hypothetical protein
MVVVVISQRETSPIRSPDELRKKDDFRDSTVPAVRRFMNDGQM